MDPVVFWGDPPWERRVGRGPCFFPLLLAPHWGGHAFTRGDEEALHAACRQEEAKASRDRREAYADAFA